MCDGEHKFLQTQRGWVDRRRRLELSEMIANAIVREMPDMGGITGRERGEVGSLRETGGAVGVPGYATRISAREA
jgi:hypothetical protein